MSPCATSTSARGTWAPTSPSACCTSASTAPDKRNAITQDMYRGLKRAAIIADGDAEVDVLCLTGSGDVFAVGGA
ncbi:MAG: hypothetical protein U0802_22840 [Candidatus Binatia bacterium]